MDKYEKLCTDIADVYAGFMNDYGAMHVFMKECATGYIHSFNIRALCSMWKLTGDDKYLAAVKAWADLSVRMQGTYGDPAAYNMGYLFEAPGNVPKSWFCADTLDQGFALLNVAMILEPDDPLFIKILDSVLRYESYIRRWYLGEDGFAVGFMDGEEPAGAYHTAVTRAICFYASMLKIFNKEVYRARGKALLEYLLDKLDMNSNYHGSPLHNRCYASDALACGYYVLSTDGDAELKKRILNKMENELLPWAVSHQTPDGFWAHDRFGYQPGAAKPVIDKKSMGAYSWGMVAGFQVFAGNLLSGNRQMRETLDRAYEWLLDNVVVGDPNRWGYHGWVMLALLALKHPDMLFPFGDKIEA